MSRGHPPRPALLALCAILAGCTSKPTIPSQPDVDLQRFMGNWYVIATIPTRPERDACNAVEHYDLRADGKVQTTYGQRKGGFDGPLDTMHPVGTVRPGTGNAVWGMQFVWPIQAEYVIAWVDPDYRETIIARSKRDHAWIMARTPAIPRADLVRLQQKLRDLGYSLDALRLVPQRWPETGPDARPPPH